MHCGILQILQRSGTSMVEKVQQNLSAANFACVLKNTPPEKVHRIYMKSIEKTPIFIKVPDLFIYLLTSFNVEKNNTYNY